MIDQDRYMMGTRIVQCHLEARDIMVRVGGGYREFHEYTMRCQDIEIRKIQLKIEQTGLTLD